MKIARRGSTTAMEYKVRVVISACGPIYASTGGRPQLEPHFDPKLDGSGADCIDHETALTNFQGLCRPSMGYIEQTDMPVFKCLKS